MRAGFHSENSENAGDPGKYLAVRIEKLTGMTSLVVQGLKICLPVQGTGVGSLVRELRYYMPQGN